MTSRSACLVLLLAAISAGCNAIPITIPDPAATPDGGFMAPDAGEVGGGDLSSADAPPSNLLDGGPVPIADMAAPDLVDRPRDAVGEQPAPDGTAVDGAPDGLPPPADSAPDALPVEAGAPDALGPVEGGLAPDALPALDVAPEPDL